MADRSAPLPGVASAAAHLILALSAFVSSSHDALGSPSPAPAKQRGVSWVAAAPIVGAQLEPVSALGANWIAQEPFGWQRDPKAPEIVLSTSSKHAYWGESDEGIRETARLARAKGIRTLLKPHLWVRGGGWVGDIRMDDDREWAAWFGSYRTFILHYATLAEANGIEALCIGTELRNASVGHQGRWRALIREIRTIYRGQLTYAANWNDEYDRIEFWDALDFIGVQAYFPLTQRTKPTVAELAAGWKPHLAALRAVSVRFGKPVVFTEVGYRSTSSAAIEPWSWPEHDGNALPPPDDDTQARCFQALFQTFWTEPWFGGAYIWKWYPEGKASRKDTATDFTPQGKPAENVIRSWYAKAR
ncbi:MAG: glycoside hydrolase TIM-barrel-like domain-containing protein [Thermoanaerobaculia bacterium]|jgi:hypothetical protein